MFYLLYVVGFKWNKNLIVEIFCGNFFLVVIDNFIDILCIIMVCNRLFEFFV